MVFSPSGVRQQASHAAAPVEQEDVTTLAMQVQVLKRKGPPLAQPLVLPAGSTRLAQVLAAGGLRSQQRRGRGGGFARSTWVAIPRFCCARCVWDAVGRQRAGGLQEPARGWKGWHALDRLAVPGVR